MLERLIGKKYLSFLSPPFLIFCLHLLRKAGNFIFYAVFTE